MLFQKKTSCITLTNGNNEWNSVWQEEGSHRREAFDCKIIFQIKLFESNLVI